ncbi:U3 small nucleolar ribonucleoprotein [Musa troglodytarum]|uniref:U3 small nucleolar ribonucleoprotein protein IMP3 n=1 Tax=Musa troglodytarum TaxID=320322 RepID=A0A9E7JZH5_9LILI|nr:U3 small nucleolar ribonucleoprotein [Musa troglodytarum]
MRKLKFHEKKLLKKVNFIEFKREGCHREALVTRRYHLTERDDYKKYSSICRMVQKLVHNLKQMDPRDPFRIEMTDALLEKLTGLPKNPAGPGAWSLRRRGRRGFGGNAAKCRDNVEAWSTPVLRGRTDGDGEAEEGYQDLREALELLGAIIHKASALVLSTFKLYNMGVISTKKSLAKCDKLSVSSFCRRRLATVLVYLKFSEHLREAVTYIEQGHVRVGPEVVTDPAFLMTRNMEDFVTWVDVSKIKRKVMEYTERLDDYDALNA